MLFKLQPCRLAGHGDTLVNGKGPLHTSFTVPLCSLLTSRVRVRSGGNGELSKEADHR